MSIKKRARKIEKLYQELEEKILKEVAEILKEGQEIDRDTNITNWRVEKLRLLGKLNNRQRVLLAEYSKKTLKEISEFAKEVGIEEVDSFEKNIDEYIQMNMLDYIESDSILNNILVTLNAMNANKINLINANVLNATGKAYVDIVEKTTVSVLAGDKTLYQAITQTAKEFAKKGVPALITIDGRSLSLEGYVPTVIRSTQKQVGKEVQEGLMNEYDIDLVEISSHLGSRPSHAPFQGRIFSRSGKSKKYPPLENTGYGKIDGLVTGINCRHIMYPYIEGVSTKRYEPHNLKQNEEEYKKQQRQRHIERKIRSAKREEQILKGMGAKEEDIQKAHRKVLDNQKLMREFINKTGLSRSREREQIR